MDQAEPCVCADFVTNTFEPIFFYLYIKERKWDDKKENNGNLIGNREWMDENV